MIDTGNKLASFLKLSGVRIIQVDDVYWQEYNKFMTPAYLPHCTPRISTHNAKKIIKLSRMPFARWTSNFGRSEASEWWYVVHEGPYSLRQCKKKTRWQINKGKKKLFARALSFEDIMTQGYDVCKRAAERFDDNSFLISELEFMRRVTASKLLPGVIEYFGVFCNDKLVALAENLVQENAVFWDRIWYDPSYLKNFKLCIS